MKYMQVFDQDVDRPCLESNYRFRCNFLLSDNEYDLFYINFYPVCLKLISVYPKDMITDNSTANYNNAWKQIHG